MKNVIIAILLVSFISVDAFAGKKERARRHGTMIGQQTGDAISKNSQANTGVQQTDYDSIKQSSVDNVNNGQKGQTVAYLMAGGLAVMAARYYGMCGGWNLAACAAGAVLAAMALSANKSGKSFDAPNADSWNNVCQYSAGGCGNMPNPYKAAVDYNGKDKALKEAEDFNKSKGVSVDASSGIVKFPDGKEVNMNDPSSMSAALGPDMTAKIMGSVKSLEQEALQKVSKMEPSSLNAAYGMGGSGEFTAGAGFDDETAAGLGVAGLAMNKRKPAQVSGLTKNFNGEPVGVAGDNLFLIMNRRYKLKSDQKSFFGAEFSQ